MAVAIVTGGSQGFGKALAAGLARDGWDVVIDGRRPGPLAEAAAAIEGDARGRVVAIAGDVTDAEHRAALVAAARALGDGRIDLLVNNASTLGPVPLRALVELSVEDLGAIYEVNVFAPLALVTQALAALSAAGGTIVNITSDAAVEGYETWGGYGSSKAALEQATNVLAAEHPELRVYRFDPGDMRTQMHQDAFLGEDISDRPEPETVVPAVRALLEDAPKSGRYRAADFVGSVA